MFDNDPQRIFIAEIQRSFDKWSIAGFFNPEKSGIYDIALPLERIGLQKGTTYLLYDFWDEKFLGEIKDSIHLSVLPETVKLLSIHEKKDYPWFISTSRHVMQGALELDSVMFDPQKMQLSGISKGANGSTHDVIVYIPEPYYWSPSMAKLYDDYEGYTVKMVDNKILRLRIHFDASGTLRWKVSFRKNPE